MELGRTEAKFFGMPGLLLVEIPHHPTGGAKPGEHKADAEIAVEPVHAGLTVTVPSKASSERTSPTASHGHSV